MKFSYTLIKKYLPGVKSKNQVIEALNMHAFEAEDREGNTIDVSIPTNRYSDAASHMGIARELAVILDLDDKNIPDLDLDFEGGNERGGDLVSIKVKNNKLCPRYTASVFEDVEVGESPDWLKDILEECGLRSVNNIVDVMNYVMLEIGQPLHAFDLDKVSGEIVVRKAKDGEDITTIDKNTFKLSDSSLLVADSEKPLAIAGIKGGKAAEVNEETNRIVVESASFDRASIYRTSRDIGLTTDASLRFSHNLSIHLPMLGLKRVEEVLEDLLGVESEEIVDTNPQKVTKRTAPFDVDELNSFIGSDIDEEEVESILEKLGFERDGNHVHVSPLREDVSYKEDVAEEIVRIIGLDNLKPDPPTVTIKPLSSDFVFLFRDKVRNILTGVGFDETYNYSFVGGEGPDRVKVKNPISEDKDFLRDSLLPLINYNLDSNFRFFDEVRVFEIGRVFSKNKEGIKEENKIGIGLGFSSGDPFFELKGVVEGLLSGLGLVSFSFSESDSFSGVDVVSDGSVLGRVVRVGENKSVAELDFNTLADLVDEELSYKPLPKYPSVSRDLSMVVGSSIKIGNIIQEIQLSNQDLIRDVDLIDEYFGEEKEMQSITLRIIFQSDQKTLKSEEVDKEMNKIISLMEDDFDADIE